ncbi:MAG: chloramphenicol acetyltransferase [Oscillibacter sp.]|jgi:chloramphenicol O-acetyltransferase type A|nr:chloramphenicol acetyltransferase [Oscillibacter sp.]
MKVIDLSTWDRTAHYQFFHRMDYAQYAITVRLDVTDFVSRLKAESLPFYDAMIYAATRVLNEQEAFRYRIHGQQVVLHERIHPSFTDMTEGSDLFKMVTVDYEDDIRDFCAHARAKSDAQTACFVKEELEGRDDLVFITCIPWVTFTHLSHTISFNRDDAVPRLAWGKYEEEHGRLMLPFSVQAHHSFVDGVHMGRYIEALQDYLNRAEG